MELCTKKHRAGLCKVNTAPKSIPENCAETTKSSILKQISPTGAVSEGREGGGQNRQKSGKNPVKMGKVPSDGAQLACIQGVHVVC